MMKRENQKVPELRFKGFSADWEQRELGKEAEIIMGTSPKSENYTENPSDYILVQGNADIKDGWVQPRMWTKQVTKIGEAGDIIFTVRAPVGHIGKTKYDVVLGRGVASIRGNEFVYQYLKSLKNRNYWTRYSTGSTFDSVNSKEVKDAIIKLPVIEEQNKIGEFLKEIDRTIALHQRKSDELDTFKRSLLQNLFPEIEKDYPALRFKDFKKKWQELKLIDVCDHQIKGTAKKSSVGYGENEYLDTQRLNGAPAEYTNLSINVNIDDIIILWDGSKAGTIYFGYEGVLGSTLKAIKIKKNTDPDFIYQYLIKYQTQIYAHYRTPNIPHVVKDFINIFPIKLPSYKEQKKIGVFLRNIDSQIKYEQQKIRNLKELKKSYLQKIFI